MYIRELDSQDELPLVLLSAPRSCVRLTKDELRYAVYRLIGSNERLRADTERMQRTNALLFQIYTHVSGGNLLPNLEPPNLPIAGANQPNFPVAGANQPNFPVAGANQPNLPVAGANQPQPAVQDPGLVAANQYMHLRYGELQRAQLQLTLTNDNLSEELSRVVRVNAVLTSYIDRLTPLAPQHQPHNAAGVLPHNDNPNPPGVLPAPELDSQDELPLVLLNAPRSCCRPTKHEQFRAVLNLRRTAERLTVENSRLNRMNAMLLVLFQRLTGGVLSHQAVPVAGAFGQQQNEQPANAFAVPPVVPVVPVNANNNRHSYIELQRELDTLTGTVDVLTEQNSRLAHTNDVLFGHVFKSVPPNVPPPFVPVAQAAPQHQPHISSVVALPNNVNPNPPGVFQLGQQLFDDNLIDAYLQNMDPN